MPRHIKLNEHLSVAELEQRYRQAEAPVTRSHFHILWLLAQGKTAQAVAEVTGYSPYWVGQIARRYNQSGPNAMGDQRRHNPGGQWLLSEEQKAQLDQALQQPPADAGLWTGPKVAAWIEKKIEKPVHPQRGWDYLRLLDYTPQVPRPRHHKADAQAQEVFKKNPA
jgi:transposase